MAQYFEPATDTDANFANSVSGQNNSFFLPSIYSKKVLNFFRKASVVEAITNTDYAGEISAYGDSVKIIKASHSEQTYSKFTREQFSALQAGITKSHPGSMQFLPVESSRTKSPTHSAHLYAVPSREH